VNYLTETLRRVAQTKGWVAAQFWATLAVLLAGVVWTRVPEKHLWQVGLTILLPLLMLAAVLALEAGTMRGLVRQEERRVRFVWGALTLLVWIAVVWLAWFLLDWCDDRIPLWASYLNSHVSAHGRAVVFTYAHIARWLTIIEWILRWIAVPAKVIPHAVASTQWGWRLPWRKLFRLLLNWRWWLGAVIAALVGVLLPSHFFNGQPHGSVLHQELAVSTKLLGAYLLAVTSWVLLLAWAAVVVARQEEPPKDAADQAVFAILWKSRGWIGAQYLWLLLWVLADLLARHLFGFATWQMWLSTICNEPLHIVLALAMAVLQTLTMRSMLIEEERRIRLVWGALASLLGDVIAYLVYACAQYARPAILQWIVCWLVIPVVFVPIVAAMSQWGFRLPWRRVLPVLRNWRWWTGVIAASLIGVGLPSILNAIASAGSGLPVWGVKVPGEILCLACWILLLGWFVFLFERDAGCAHAGDEAMQLVPVGSGPLGEDSVKLPLPKSGNDAGGKI
jgi:hypothetical protein